MTRIVFGMSGASGMPLAVSALESISALPGIEIHLVASKWARHALREECGMDIGSIAELVPAVYRENDMSAPPASGSWPHDGMIICPCSMSSLGAIATGAGRSLIHRAADVCLKERRPLILVARETPLNLVHIRNMLAATEAGAIIMPFVPAFYTGENSMRGAMLQFTGRMLDILGVPHNFCSRWGENGR